MQVVGRLPAASVVGAHPVVRVAELAACAALAWGMLTQLFGYGVTPDPDPDGYVSYAEHIKATWTLMDHRRLPGYAFFLAAVDSIGPSKMHLDVYWAQLGLYVAWVAGLWFWIRRRLGPLIGLLFLGLLAAPSFYTRYAVVMVADFVGSLVFTATALVLARLVLAASTKAALRWLTVLVGLFALTFVIHPYTRMMLALFIASMSLVVLVFRGKVGGPGAPRRRVRPRLVRLASALAALFVVTGAVGAVVDRGNSEYNAAWLANWMVICLPPATNTEDDRQIEAMKAAASARLGYPVAHAPPITHPEFIPLHLGKFPIVNRGYPTLASLDGGPFPNERLVPLWQGRVLAHPLELLRCGGKQMFWRYHIFEKQYAPFSSEARFVTLTYIPESDAVRSRVFRTYGIELLNVTDDAPWSDVAGPLAFAVGRIVLTFVILGVGTIALVRHFGPLVLAVPATMLGWYVFLGLVLPIEPRYFIVYGPGIYLAEAVGIATIALAVLRAAGLKVPA